MYDLIIKNGKVVSGTGNPWFRADLAILDKKIKKIGKLIIESADKIINAKDFIVAPGFIDIHSHADFTLLVNSKAESYVRQGVTTVVIGNCGHTPYPVQEKRKAALKSIILGYIPNVEIDWISLDGYLKRLEKKGIALNVVPLIGHGAVRVAVMGFDARLPTEDEMKEMKRWVKRALEEGAFGLSSGLEYPPGFYSNTEEIVELCKVVTEYGRLYVTHIRNRGDGMMAATEEAINIGELAGISVHISHHIPRYPAENIADKVLGLIDKARARGLDVSCDALVPFVRENSLERYMFAPGMLSAILPNWAFEGGMEKLQGRLKDEGKREEMRTKNTKPQASLAMHGQWHRIFIDFCISHPEYIGKNIKHIAEKEHKDPWDVVFDILLDEGKNCYNVKVISAAYTLDDGIKVLCHSTSSPMSDGLALAPYRPLNNINMGLGSYGFIPYFFEKYMRERKLLSLEEAVRKCTSLPAQRFNIEGRGVLKKDMWADIVIFDPDRIKCKATFAQPNQYPEGIEYVIVNGEVVVEKNQHTDALPGKPLRAE